MRLIDQVYVHVISVITTIFYILLPTNKQNSLLNGHSNSLIYILHQGNCIKIKSIRTSITIVVLIRVDVVGMVVVIIVVVIVVVVVVNRTSLSCVSHYWQ